MGELALTKTTPERSAPLSIRVEPTFKEQIDALAIELGIKPHKLVVACLRLGFRDLGKDRTEIKAALHLAAEAEAAVMNLPEATPPKKTPAKKAAPKKSASKRA